MTVLPATSTRILNIAHRGARAFAPENTLAAFAKAKSLGCDMIELDVCLSKDGEVIVYHDDHLKRCTNAERMFPGRESYQTSDFTYQELKCLDAGSWFADELKLPNEKRQPYLQSLSSSELAQFVSETELKCYASGEIKIPTLTEALLQAKDSGIRLNIELKSQGETDPALITAVLRNIHDTNMADLILISSFNHDLIGQIRLQNKTIETAILIEKPLSNPLATLRKFKANAYNLGCFHGNFDSKTGQRYLSHIEKICKAGFAVNIWTCNDPTEMAWLLTPGITGLISDYPNRVRDVLADFVLKQRNP